VLDVEPAEHRHQCERAGAAVGSARRRGLAQPMRPAWHASLLAQVGHLVGALMSLFDQLKAADRAGKHCHQSRNIGRIH
jgi:hypothetical protein